MIERLLQTLRGIAGPADAEAFAADYADSLRLITACQQIELSSDQREALERLEDHLEARHGALRESPARNAARRLAREALEVLGHAEAPR